MLNCEEQVPLMEYEELQERLPSNQVDNFVDFFQDA